MSRMWVQRRTVLLVMLTVLLMVSTMAAVGNSALAPQQHGTLSGGDGPSPDERLNGTATTGSAPRFEPGWNMGRANAANTNHINTTGPTNPITRRWTFALEADDFGAGPLVVNGTVYFGTRYIGSEEGERNKRGQLYAVDAWTGETRWTFQPPSGFHPSHIAVLRNTVYVSMNHGKVYALDAATGDVYWRFVPDGSARDLKVANRTLYLTSGKPLGKGHVYALGALRGEERWQFTTEEMPPGLAVKDDTVYVSSKGGKMYALDAETGGVNWNVDIVPKNDTEWLNQPTVENNLVYVSNRVFHNKDSDSHLYALDAKTGEIHWKRTKPRANGFSTPAVLGDTVYFTGKYLHAADARTGADRWSNRNLRGSPVLLNDIGYIHKGGASGALYTLDPETGTHHARFTTPQFNNSWDKWRSGVAVLNGSLYTGVGYDVPGNSYRSDYTEMYALGTPEFTYTNLSVRPQDPELNESVTAAVTVRNTGTGPGTVNATLFVNGNGTNTTMARLDPRTSQTVTFTHRYPQNGTYTVEIGGLSRTITVGDVASASTPTPTTMGDADSPTTTEPSEKRATAAGGDSTPAAATPTATLGTVPGFGVAGWVVAVALVAVLIGIHKRD